MKKLILATVFFSVCLALAVTSFFLGERLTTQKYSKSESLLSDKSLEFFCASSGCQQIGVKGTISEYNYAEKKISLLIANGQQMPISLKEEVRIDDQYGVSYFETTMRRGDVIYAIFDTKKLYYAVDVYFDKTGVLSKKRMPK